MSVDESLVCSFQILKSNENAKTKGSPFGPLINKKYFLVSAVHFARIFWGYINRYFEHDFHVYVFIDNQ